MNKPVTYTPPGGEPKKKRDPVARFWLSHLRAAQANVVIDSPEELLRFASERS